MNRSGQRLNLEIGQNATLAAGLPGMDGTQNIPCIIKGILPHGATKAVGLQFVDLDEKIAEGISKYVRKVLSYLEAEEPA
jgi:enhancing lycopene biosynthesis protein 2